MTSSIDFVVSLGGGTELLGENAAGRKNQRQLCSLFIEALYLEQGGRRQGTCLPLAKLVEHRVDGFFVVNAAANVHLPRQNEVPDFMHFDEGLACCGFLPGRKKLLYELRKQAGSWVATNAAGHLYDAQAFLGHKSFATTERYYAKNLNRPKAACLHPARNEEK